MTLLDIDLPKGLQIDWFPDLNQIVAPSAVGLLTADLLALVLIVIHIPASILLAT